MAGVRPGVRRQRDVGGPGHRRDRASRSRRCCSAPTRGCSTPTRGEPDTGAPVLFVGNSRDVYRRSVRSALAVGAQVEVHGSDWERFLAPHFIASKIVANEDLGALYCSAGVVLNDHHDDMRRDGFLANRLFDVTACAARLVTDEIDGLSDVFGDVVRTFHDETEMGPLLADPATAFPLARGPAGPRRDRDARALLRPPRRGAARRRGSVAGALIAPTVGFHRPAGETSADMFRFTRPAQYCLSRLSPAARRRTPAGRTARGRRGPRRGRPA